MAKRYTLEATDGKKETMNEEAFDYAVLVALNRLTRTGDWVSVYALARTLYARPNGRTFDNVIWSLKRSLKKGEVRRDGSSWQVTPRSTR